MELLVGRVNQKKSLVVSCLAAVVVAGTLIVPSTHAFVSRTRSSPTTVTWRLHALSTERRRFVLASSSSLLSGGFLGGGNGNRANAVPNNNNIRPPSGGLPTNQVVGKLRGMRRKRLGGSDVAVSEMGLGAQRWVSADYNAPDEGLVFDFLDKAVLEHGVNLIDTAEQYPIPSDNGVTAREGDSERLIGKWLQQRKGRVGRDQVVIASKITGGRNVTPRNIIADCEGSLQRLGTDYIDVYQLHWPQRYSPQSNWGQSLSYHIERDASPYWRAGGGPTTFEDLCGSMEKLIQQGKIRAWGLCNDNAYGLTACTRMAKAMGTTPPACLMGDYSLLDRKSDENGVAEAASPYNENVGFMAYNALAGGMLTGKVRSEGLQISYSSQSTRTRRASPNSRPNISADICLLLIVHGCARRLG